VLAQSGRLSQKTLIRALAARCATRNAANSASLSRVVTVIAFLPPLPRSHSTPKPIGQARPLPRRFACPNSFKWLRNGHGSMEPITARRLMLRLPAALRPTGGKPVKGIQKAVLRRPHSGAFPIASCFIPFGGAVPLVCEVKWFAKPRNTKVSYQTLARTLHG